MRHNNVTEIHFSVPYIFKYEMYTKYANDQLVRQRGQALKQHSKLMKYVKDKLIITISLAKWAIDKHGRSAKEKKIDFKNMLKTNGWFIRA